MQRLTLLIERQLTNAKDESSDGQVKGTLPS
jgi:hypothetical protein